MTAGRIGARLPFLAVLLLALTRCDRAGRDSDRHPDWIIHSRVVFLSEDLGREQAPQALKSFRLLLPYICGDLYGPPTTGDFIHPVLDADYRFEIDLYRSEKMLLASLEPTQLSLEYLRIEPADARIARLAPMALQADGIEQVGRADWVDLESRQRLLLIYADRPARISGATLARGRMLRFDIFIATPGYVWVGRQARADGDVYSVVPRPAQPVVAVTPSG